jgi:hypothetical protein
MADQPIVKPLADPTTPNLGLVLPAVGADQDSWGGLTNNNWQLVDSLLGSTPPLANAAAANVGTSLTWARADHVHPGGGDAPSNGTSYGRMNANWVPVLPLAGGAISGGINVGGASIFNSTIQIYGATTFTGTATFGNNPVVSGQGIIYSLSSNNAHRQYWSPPSLSPIIDGTNAGLGAYVMSSSDVRTKRNIVPSGDALADLARFRVVSFDRTIGPAGYEANQHHAFGVIAQEVAEHAPDCAYGAEDPQQTAGLEVLPILGRCIKAIQQLAASVAALEARLDAV